MLSLLGFSPLLLFDSDGVQTKSIKCVFYDREGLRDGVGGSQQHFGITTETKERQSD